MDFTTTGAPPVPIRINGKAYQIPRFLLPAQREWAALKVKEQEDAALAYLPDADAKARFRLFFRPPPIDLLTLADEGRTPDGVAYVLAAQFDKAGVPPEDRDALLANGDPVQLRALADKVLSARQAAATLAADSNEPGAKADPTNGPAPTSEGLRGTTETTSQPSPQPTAA